MMTKKELLEGLGHLVDLEEGMVTLYANFDGVLIKLDEEMDAARKQELRELLMELHRDSSKHRDMIYEMLEKVGASDKDDY